MFVLLLFTVLFSALLDTNHLYSKKISCKKYEQQALISKKTFELNKEKYKFKLLQKKIPLNPTKGGIQLKLNDPTVKKLMVSSVAAATYEALFQKCLDTNQELTSEKNDDNLPTFSLKERQKTKE